MSGSSFNSRPPIRLALGALMAAALACSLLPGGAEPAGGPEAPPGGAQAPAAAPTPTPEVAAPPPEDFFNLLDQRIQAGEDPGALIVQNLRIFAGELSLAEVYGTDEVAMEGTWGLFNLAADYLETGDDESAKDEIRRLMGIIAPPQENLDAYAQPAPTSGRGRFGLAAPARDEVCEQIWNAGFPQNVDPKPTCLLYESGPTAGGHFYRLYFPAEYASDPARMNLVKAAADALKETVSVYTGLGLEVRSITMLFTLLQPAGETDSLAVTPGLSQSQIQTIPCPILVYPLAHGLNYGNFKQTIAHEMMHCAHYWRYGVTNYAVTKWWEEATAEYFSNLAYPANNYEFRFNAAFDFHSPTARLTSMSYHNVGFFQYLENVNGPGSALAFTDVMKKGGTLAEQIATLHAYPNIEDLYHNFGQAYLDGKIIDSGGGALPYSPQPGVPITAGSNAILNTPSLVLTRYAVVFPKGNEYAIGGGDATGDGRNSAKPGVSGPGWGALPATVYAGCNQSSVTVLLTTTTPAEGDTYSIDIQTIKGQELGCDSCLFGKWQLQVDPQLRPFFEQTFTEAGMTLESLTGTFDMSFGQDGTWNHTPTDYGASVSIPSDFMTTEIAVALYGGMDAKFNVNKEKTVIYLSETNPYLTINTVVFLNGQPIDSTSPLDPSMFGSFLDIHTREYVCSGNTLTVTVPLGMPNLPFLDYVYTRK